MSNSLRTASADAPRAWFLFKAQAVAHAAFALVIGVGTVSAWAQLRGRTSAVTVAAALLSLAWIAGLVAMRRKSARLRTQIPLPSSHRHALLLAAVPLLQLAGIVPSFFLPDPEAGYAILALTSSALFVVVLLSGICFALAEVPIRWDGWMVTLGTSFVAGVVLVWLALSNFRIF